MSERTDADLPANTLTFSLDSGAPAGASITGAGVFTWTPTNVQTGDFTVTVRVTDNGSPNLNDFETITIHVDASVPPPVYHLTDLGTLGGSISNGNRRRSRSTVARIGTSTAPTD